MKGIYFKETLDDMVKSLTPFNFLPIFRLSLPCIVKVISSAYVRVADKLELM